jgi:hypothetical protein
MVASDFACGLDDRELAAATILLRPVFRAWLGLPRYARLRRRCVGGAGGVTGAKPSTRLGTVSFGGTAFFDVPSRRNIHAERTTLLPYGLD